MTYAYNDRGQTSTNPPWMTKRLAPVANATVISVPISRGDSALAHRNVAEQLAVHGGLAEQQAASNILQGTAARNTRTLSSDVSIEASVSALVASAVMAALEQSASRFDRRLFLEQAEVIQWRMRSPDELVKAIDLALHLGLTALAMKLAGQGKVLFPHHERVQCVAHALAPAIVHTTQTPAVSRLDASRAWLREHSGDYRGQWVAVRDGELVGVAKSLKELTTIVNQDPNNTITVKVL